MDKHRVSYAMYLAFFLAFIKDAKCLPQNIKNSVKAYTNWNLTMFVIRYIFSIKEWDSFLCVNSMSILLSYNTAFCKNLQENLRDKLKLQGLPLSKFQFKFGDFIVHYLPAFISVYNIVKNKTQIPLVTSTYALTLSTWFAFCQVGNLDGSCLYVPHSWKRGWSSFFLTSLLTPNLTHYLINKDRKKILLCSVAMILPLILQHIDYQSQVMYKFQYMLNKAKVSYNLQNKKETIRKVQSCSQLIDIATRNCVI